MSSPMLQTNYILTDGTFFSEAYLEHHGIKGQKWGVRRYQNPDGTWTETGKVRRRETESYVNEDGTLTEAGKKQYKKINDKYWKNFNAWEKGTASKVDDRINELAASNKEIAKIISEHTGDGYELAEKIIGKTGDSKLMRYSEDADELWELIEMERNDALAALNKNEDYYRDKKVKHSEGGTYMDYILTDGTFASEAYLEHHGIKGQKWGVRRYQNPDGTWTELGKRQRRSFREVAADYKERAVANHEARVEKQKQNAIQKGDAKTVLKYRDKMTLAELKEAKSRIEVTKAIAELNKEKKTSTLVRLTEKGKALVSAIETGKKLKDLLSGEKKKDDKPTMEEEAYKETLKEYMKSSARDARDSTKGTASEKEAAALVAIRKISESKEPAVSLANNRNYNRNKSLTEKIVKMNNKPIEEITAESKEINDIWKSIHKR